MGTGLVIGLCAGVVLTLMVAVAIDRYETCKALQRQPAKVVPLRGKQK